MYGMEFLKTWITTCTLTFSCIYQDEKQARCKSCTACLRGSSCCILRPLILYKYSQQLLCLRALNASNYTCTLHYNLDGSKQDKSAYVYIPQDPRCLLYLYPSARYKVIYKYSPCLMTKVMVRQYSLMCFIHKC